MINKFIFNKLDEETLQRISTEIPNIKADFNDYKKVVVKKPWGYEYLIFQSKCSAIWILYIKPGHQTSMHCHPQKKTSLIVLEGKVECSSLNKSIIMSLGQGLIIDKGSFHQTKALSKNGCFVMEIETPVNKHDLVRLKDSYKRVGKGYETVDKHKFSPNYNYLNFGESKIYYNTIKRFGQCTMSIKQVKTKRDIDKMLKNNVGNNLLSLLEGVIYNNDKPLMEPGDTITIATLKKQKKLSIRNNLILLIINNDDTQIKVSDYVISFLKSLNIDHIFIVPGDANLHLMDSVGRDEDINYTCFHTEKAASMAADAYSKLKGHYGVLIISSGASGTNALTGLANAWTDSSPLIVLSGQATSDQYTKSEIRQLGNKSLNIIDIVKPLTKYAVRIDGPLKLNSILERAAFFANEGRPGPVWIDIPIDIQGMIIDNRNQKNFDPPLINTNAKQLTIDIKDSLNLIRDSSKPVLFVGNGVRLSGAVSSLDKLVDKMNIPVLTSRRGADIVPNNHKLYFGRPGAYGQRAANFIVQKSDLLICIGARLSIPQIGRSYKYFAQNAKKIIVDIDPMELQKKTVSADIAINEDSKVFIDVFLNEIIKENFPNFSNWISQCKTWIKNFPPNNEKSYSHKKYINPYLFIDILSKQLCNNDTIVVDGGAIMNYVMQTFIFKKGQRMISSTGVELPGFAIPASVGCALVNSKNNTICLCEDLGFEINSKVLEIIREKDLPIKILVFRSVGYSNIRKIQREYFGGRYIGTINEQSKVPDLLNIGGTYGFETCEINNANNLGKQIKYVINSKNSIICIIQLDSNIDLTPRIVMDVNSKGEWEAKPLDDMYPFLDKDLLKKYVN
tara:strand:- start:7083 stop:9620 length:2538 start_codon:yes stop_codon:yes gene_type:complete